MERFKGGSRLREIREAKKLTRRAVCNVAGITENTLQKWENGVAFPRMDLFMRVAIVYGMKPDELLKEVSK